jgi:hypothetical protein
MRALAMALSLCAACAVDADFSDTQFACDDDADCPSGEACVEDVCVASDPDDVVDPASCDRASAFDDDFGSTSIDDAWESFATGGGATLAQNGDARFALAAGEAGEAGYRTRCRYDVTADAVHVTVEDTADDAGETFFELVGGGGEVAAIRQQGSVLKLITRSGGSNATQTQAYDEGAHEVWRIACANGSVEYAVSADGSTWQVLGARQAPAGMDDAYVQFGVRTQWAALADDASFDDYNGG